ncbi:MAG: hypothetical protein MPJ50_05455 [Pirellulales bacterium]|nr:hypothetical protein [Pirellulales bacterium]
MALRALLTIGFCVLWSLAVFLTPTQDALGQDETAQSVSEQSYQAVVISQNAEVRSGPGREYYATQPIRHGARVQVFGEQSGWLAIRPPEGSFSWLRSEDIQRETAATQSDERGGLAKAYVRRSGVISQVGSQLTPDRDVWQVELKRDEEVYVLGHSPSDPEWTKIAPPAGEFRWIRATDVRRAETEDSATSGLSTKDDNRRSSFGHSQWSARTPAEEIEAINMELSDAVCHGAGSEDLAYLADRAADVLDQTQDARQTRLANRLAERIETFLDLARRQERLERRVLVASRQGTSTTQPLPLAGTGERGRTGKNNPATTSRPLTGPATLVSGSVEPRYDAMGILTPVSSRNTSAAQYALLDEAGQLQSYLTAAPGLRLQAFEGRYVGVTGSRGFSPELNARHVTARQVHALDTPIRRE